MIFAFTNEPANVSVFPKSEIVSDHVPAVISEPKAGAIKILLALSAPVAKQGLPAMSAAVPAAVAALVQTLPV